MADMFGFQNMDVSIELESLECGGLDFDEVNILDGLPSPPHSDNIHFGALASLLPHEEQQQPGAGEVESSVAKSGASLPANITDAELAAAVAGDWEAQINGSTAASDTLAAVTVSQVLVDPTTDVNAPTQPHPLHVPLPKSPSPLEDWFSRGISAALRAQQNRPDSLSSQHENMHMPRGMDLSKEHDTNKQTVLGKNMAPHSASRGINQQQQHPSQPSSIMRDPTERGVGVTGTGTLTQGQLLSNKPPLTRSNSRGSRYLRSPPRNDARDLRWAPNSLAFETAAAIHRPQLFSPLTARGSLVPTPQHTSDSQSSMQPPCPSPTYSRLESSSTSQSATVTAPVPPNTHDHQPVQRLMLPEPAVSTRTTILSPNDHPQPGSSAMTLTFFGAGPFVPQRYPDIRDYQRNYLRSQHMMSRGFVHQTLGLTPLSGSPPVSDNSKEHNQQWSRSNVQGSTPSHGPPILPRISVSNILSTMEVEPSQPMSTAPTASSPPSLAGFKTPELSRLPCSGIQQQNVAPASTDILTANPNSGNFVTPSSSTRPPISNRVRRILNMGSTPKGPKPKAASSSGQKAGTSKKSASHANAQQIRIPEFQDPVDKWMNELETELNRAWNQPQAQPTKKKAAARSGRGSAGRREKGESSAPKRRKSNSAGKEKEGARPIPHEAQNTSAHEVNAFQDPKALEFSEQRDSNNTAYDMHFQDPGFPVDPHIKFYRTAVRRNLG